MKNNLTLIITIYNQKYSKLKFWLDFYNKHSKDMDINFLIDDPSYKYLSALKKKIRNDDLFVNEENIGKFLSVYNHIKKGHVQTGHFKVCDPDDFVSFENISKLSKLNTNFIYIFNRTNQKKAPRKIGEKEITRVINNTNKIPDISFANHITAIPTKSVFEDQNIDQNIRIYAADDKLMGNISYLNGSTIKRDENSFYYYVSYNGNTSKKSSEEYFLNLKTTYNLILALYKKNPKKIPPENYDSLLKWLRNLKRKQKRINENDFNNLIETIIEIKGLQDERNNI